MPNIAIYEGGKAARMNGVSVITTDDGNGGKVEWVPQSDRQTGTLHVSQNGTYRAEDEGLHSWSKVTVRLAGAPLGTEVPTLPDPITGAEIPTGELGQPEIVPPAGLEPIEDEPISTDEAESILDELGGYDTDPESPDYSLDPSSPDYDDAMEAIGDALGTDPEDVKIVDPDDAGSVKETEPKPEGKGQKVTGTNPETGDTETIGIKPDGTVDKEETIAEYRLYTDPSKLMYHNGESIDFTGMEFAGYSASGKVIKVIPWPDSGIETPVTTASIDDADSIDVDYGSITITLTNTVFYWTQNGKNGADYVQYMPNNTFAYVHGNWIEYLFASENGGVAEYGINRLGWHIDKSGNKIYDEEVVSTTNSVSMDNTYTNAGKTVYYGGLSYSPSAHDITANGGISGATIGELGNGLTAWIMIYGDSRRGSQNIPVSYNGHSDYFSIWIS